MRSMLMSLIAIGFLYGSEITIADSNPAKDTVVNLEKKIASEKKRFNEIKNELNDIARYLNGYERLLRDKDNVIKQFANLAAQCEMTKNNYIQLGIIETELAQKSLENCEKEVGDFIVNVKPKILAMTEQAIQKIKELHTKGIVDRNDLNIINRKIDLLKSLLNVEKDKKELGGLK